MSPKDKNIPPNYNQNNEGLNENKQRINPIFIISLIAGLITATAITSSIITAVILKQGNPLDGSNSTASPTPTVAASPTALPTPTVAASPTNSPIPTVAASPTASPTPTVAASPTASPIPTVTNLATPPANANSTPPVHNQSIEKQTVESLDFKFDLQNCQRVRETVNCNFLVTNMNKKDRQAGLYGNHNYSDVTKPQIVDYSGNQYSLQEVQLGREHSTSEAWTILIKGIPTKASISVELPQEVTKLAVVEVVFKNGWKWNLDSREGKVQFRDVAIIAASPSTDN